MPLNKLSASLVLAMSLLATACGSGPEQVAETGPDAPATQHDRDRLAGVIAVDGSSTVAPLTDAIAEEYAAEQPDVEVNIGVSGTGGGFERFCGGGLDIANASRPIKDDERAACAEGGVAFTEVRVGTDALTMVTSRETDWVDCLTKDEVVTLWGPGGATTWDEVRGGLPAEKIGVFAPGADSGTFDFMNETVLEKDVQPRQDYNASEDDNIIAQGVQGTKGSWGFFGFAYYQENADKLRAIAYDAGEGCVEPSVESAQDGSYGLTRPLFVYARNDALAKPHVAGFMRFYLDTVDEVIGEVGYIPASAEELAAAREAVEAATLG